MKFKILSLLLVTTLILPAQSIVDSYTIVDQVNDTTWLYREYNVYEYSQVFNETEYVFTDTILVPESSSYFDSTGIIQHLVTQVANEQNQQSARISRAFDAQTTLRNVTEANSMIDAISAGESNYYEESSKLFSNQLTGTYRVFYDSAGVETNQLADMTLVTNGAHPDGRIMRLAFRDGQSWNVRPYHRWSWKIVNWPYGDDSFVWHRISSNERPIYRPRTYVTRQDAFNRIIKID